MRSAGLTVHVRGGCAAVVLVLGLVLGAPSGAEAQAELAGTYVQYLGVAANGVMINAANHSMAYSETGAAPFTCDLYVPGALVEEWTIEGTGTSTFVASNVVGATAITTVTGPTVSGRTITWRGSYVNGTMALQVDQVFTLQAADRHATLDVTLTNTGSTALSNVYYLRNGDPDHGQCNIGTLFETTNDVVRQPPADSNALVVATAGTAPVVTLGMGSHDTRARAHVVPLSLNNTNASGTWNAPNDPGGTLNDVGISVAFRHASLAVGASTTFRLLYVWGPNVATVTSRFDSLGCTADGVPCMSGGAPGLCRSGACCTGCWNGSSCQAGTSAGVCGAGGLVCASCADGNVCTNDVCSAGACSNPPAASGTACDDGQYCTVSDGCNGGGACTGATRNCSDAYTCTTDTCDEAGDRCVSTVTIGCLISGTCRATGAMNPANSCLVCNPVASTSAWSPVVAGTACDDGLFCTVSDACNGTGTCTASPRDCSDAFSCTTDSCDDTADRCVSTVTAGCLIAGTCRAAGAANPSNACLVCDPTATTMAWSPAPSGTTCNDGAYCTVTDRCNGAGTCAGGPRSCSDGLTCTSDICDEAGDRCVSVVSTGCLIGGMCVTDGVANPSNVCQLCNPAVSQTAWSAAPTGGACDDGAYCTLSDACNGAGACTGMARDCSDAFSCTTDSCDETMDACVSTASIGCLVDGMCVSDGEPHPTGPCQSCRAAMSRTAWSSTASGTPCGDPVCAAGVVTSAPTCDGAGVCAPGAAMDCPDGVCVDAFSCTGMCAGDMDCPLTHFCAADMRCAEDLPLGEPCDRMGMCASGFCVDGVCCDGGCDGPCTACNGASTAGACTPHPAATDPEGDCTLPELCDGAGACEVPPMPDGGMADAGADAAMPDGAVPDARRDASRIDGAAAEGSLSVNGSGCLCRVPTGDRDPRGWPGRACLAVLVVLGLLARMSRRRRG